MRTTCHRPTRRSAPRSRSVRRKPDGRLLTAERVTKRFGGLVAVSALDFTLEEGSIVSVIGPNGAGKTTFFNCIAGFYRIDEGVDPPRRPRDQGPAAGPDRRARDQPHVPEHPAVREHDRDGERAGRPAPAPGHVAGSGGPQHARRACRGGRGHGEARRLLQYVGLQGRGRHPREQALVRRPAPARGRAGAGDEAATAAARRADRGHEPDREGRDDRLHPAPARRHRDHDPADRARDARGHGHLGADHGARLRREDRRGDAPRDPERRARDRGVPGPGQRRRVGREHGADEAAEVMAMPSAAGRRRRGHGRCTAGGHHRPPEPDRWRCSRSRTSTPTTATSTP